MWFSLCWWSLLKPSYFVLYCQNRVSQTIFLIKCSVTCAVRAVRTSVSMRYCGRWSYWTPSSPPLSSPGQLGLLPKVLPLPQRSFLKLSLPPGPASTAQRSRTLLLSQQTSFRSLSCWPVFLFLRVRSVFVLLQLEAQRPAARSVCGRGDCQPHPDPGLLPFIHRRFPGRLSPGTPVPNTVYSQRNDSAEIECRPERGV